MCVCDSNGPRRGAQISRFDGCDGPNIDLAKKKKKKTELLRTTMKKSAQ